jgi:Tol biopolymer transport system component
VNADGSNPRNLTRHPLNDGRDGGFAWSPGGRKIVFGTNRDRNRGPDGKVSAELYVMNADGSGQRRLTRTPEFEYVLSWSPDGRRLAIGRFPSTPRWAFFVMNADGSGVRKVTWSLRGMR